MWRPVGLLAAAVATLLAVSGCIPDANPPGPVPTDGLAWRDCFDQARESNVGLRHEYEVECATVRVPQDWEDPDNGKTFDIAVMRIYSGRLADKQGSVLTNPGGPGGSGLEFLPAFVQPPLSPAPTGLLEHFVLVSFDPRGVGESEPVHCIPPADLLESFGSDPDPVSQEAFDEAVALAQRIADACGDEYGEDLRLFSTVQTARDMDAIREALGEDAMTYLGFSYGTLLGAVYAQLFPNKVRALVLDAAVDPQQGPIESSEGQAKGFERALDNFDAWCRDNSAECPIAADPRGIIAAQMAKARTSPVSVGRREATAGWVLTAVVVSLYSETTWPVLATAIDDLTRGDAREVLRLGDAYSTVASFDAFYTINCADGGERPTIAEIRELQAQWRAKYPIFGPSQAVGLLTCTLWPAEPDPYPVGPAAGAPPIVVVGTLGDPATPYESTEKLARMLGTGVVVTYEGEGHGAYPSTRCIAEAVDAYLVDLKVPQDGLRCPP